MAGIRVGDCRELVKPRFCKVTEYQVRGVVHYHAVIRLDANVKDEGAFVHPGSIWSAELLAEAVKGAAKQASALFPVGNTGRVLLLRFGAESGFADTRIIRSGTATAVSRDAVANYIAKYATKVSDVPGMPSSPIRHPDEIAALRCSAHHKRLIATALQLGFAKGAHQFGNHGHFLSKSRRYSVTFGRIRRERVEYRRAQRYPDGELDPWGRPLDERVVLVVKDFEYAGAGYSAADARFLALLSAAKARAHARRFSRVSEFLRGQEGAGNA